jgi:hypothetical protein
MSDDKKVTGKGIGVGTVLFLIFLTLKLAGIGQVATWSWWWVTSPLWIPIAIVLGVAAIALLLAGIVNLFKN